MLSGAGSHDYPAFNPGIFSSIMRHTFRIFERGTYMESGLFFGDARWRHYANPIGIQGLSQRIATVQAPSTALISVAATHASR
jgi:hypothetical protein